VASAFSDLVLEFGEEAGPPPGPRVAGLNRRFEEAGNARLHLFSDAARQTPLYAEVSGPAFRGWTIGEIYRYGDLAGDTARCTRAFLEEWTAGRGRAQDLAGHFALFAWLPAQQRWSVWTDCTGSLHVYCGGSARRALGTCFEAVAEHSSRRLDWSGITTLLHNGFFLGDRTFYEDVRILRPGRRYEFDRDGLLLGSEPYWIWRHDPDTRRSEADTIAMFGETLRAVLRDQARTGRVAVPLSGGLDSRTVAACLPEDHAGPAYSYGYTKDSVEIRIASQVAAVRRLPFTAHTVQPYLFEHLDVILSALEGFQDITQARQAALRGWLGQHADYVLAAHWGDVLCDDMGTGEIEPTPGAVVDHTVKKMAKRGRAWLMENVCAPQLEGAEAGALVRSFVEREMEPLAGIEDPDFRVKVFKTAHWAFRWTLSSLRMYQVEAFPRIPFLDPRMLAFFCTVPTAMVRGRRLQIEYLKRFAPRYARIRWQETDTDLFHLEPGRASRLARRVWRRALRALRGRPLIQRNWEVQFGGGHWKDLEHWLMSPGLALHALVRPEAIRGLLDQFLRTPSAENGYAVSMLFTFSAWLERQQSHCPGISVAGPVQRGC
jgi:asparagine synthase (glutamine-hydrolysing)